MLHAGFTGASLANGAFSLAGILSGKAIAWSDVLNFANFFRLSIWWPLVIPVILFLPWRLRNGTARQLMSAPYSCALLVLSLFSLCLLIVAILVGATEVYSFSRLMSLAYPIPLCLILLLWHLSLQPVARTSSFVAFGRVVVACATLLVLWPQASYSTSRPELTWTGLKSIFGNSISLLTGRYSLKNTYQHELGWVAKSSTGAIYPAMVDAWKIAGPGTPIFSFHIHNYCMLPNCNVILPVTIRWERTGAPRSSSTRTLQSGPSRSCARKE